MNIRKIIKLSLLKVSSVMHHNNCSKILYYHDVFSTTNYKALDADVCMGTPIKLFSKHVEVIRAEGYEIVPRITKPNGQVAIMFDDGFRGVWECRRFFYDNDIKPTIFLPVAYIGKTDNGIMTKDEILELQSNGFNFECHGWSHVQLTKFSDDELVRELSDSRAYLSKMLSKDVKGICMPLGLFSDHLLEQIRKYGYTDIYSCLPGNYTDGPFGLHTRNLCQFASPTEVKLVLRGGNESLKNRYLKMHHINNVISE